MNEKLTWVRIAFSERRIITYTRRTRVDAEQSVAELVTEAAKARPKRTHILVESEGLPGTFRVWVPVLHLRRAIITISQ